MEKKCRFCHAELKITFVDLCMSPLSNSFLDKKSLNKKEQIFPLRVFVCSNCFLVQLEEFEKPENIFKDYKYFSSYSESWLNHAKKYVTNVVKQFGLNKDNFVIEIASNDGYLLQYFYNQNIPCLGIEPAKNVANIAKQKGIPTLVKFFGTKTAKDLVSKGKMADLLLGNNVLAHVPNINDFVEGIKIILKPNGVVTMEFPHLVELIDKNQFDTIYHEHFSYLSFYTVKKIFEKHGLKIFDVKELTTHGGSLRIYATHSENFVHNVNDRVDKLLEKESKFGITQISTYTDFQNQVLLVKNEICKFIDSKIKNGKKIVCYGAAAKGNTLLNYCGIGTNLIDYVVDKNPHKQGLFLPGTHIPIKDPSEIQKTKPDYLIIIPWNLQDEIMKQMEHIRKWGGKFIVLIPEVKIIT